MTTDRELLELAAKAAGYAIHDFYLESDVWAYQEGAELNHDGELPIFMWRPLTDDGDALRLAVKLNLQVIPGTYKKDEVMAYSAGVVEVSEHVHYLQDIYAATRRAIVRAAAVIGAKS